jgi:hypothetical protein
MMSAKPRKIPAYRLHRPTGQAVVRFDDHDYYLGKYGTPQSQEAYHRKVAEWITAGVLTRPHERPHTPVDISVNELILAFLNHAEGYYRRADGSPTPELTNLRLALRPLKRLYGTTSAGEFGPKALKALRQAMVDAGLCRRTVNQRVARVVRVFRFAVENELVPAAVHHALKAVPGLRVGRSGAKESRTVRPVSQEHVEAVRPYVSRQLWAVIQLQLLSGMRSGEALIMLRMRSGHVGDGLGLRPVPAQDRGARQTAPGLSGASGPGSHPAVAPPRPFGVPLPGPGGEGRTSGRAPPEPEDAADAVAEGPDAHRGAAEGAPGSL